MTDASGPRGGRPRIVVSCRAFPETIALLSDAGDVVSNQTGDALSPGALLERCRTAAALVAFMPDRVDDAFLAECPELRVVACALKGADNFDIEACTRRGVWLSLVPDLLMGPTAELAVGLMIGLGRHLLAGERLVRGGGFAGWRPTLYGAGLSGSTVGIIGMGSVGRAIAERLQGFGAELLYHDITPVDAETHARLRLTRVPLAEIAARADFIVVAVPLTADTAGLIGRRFLETVKPGALLVNPARGSVVDEAAVARALQEGLLGGYAADVFAFEDWARDDRPPGIPDALIAMRDRTLFTPHIGSAVVGVRREIEREAACAVRDALAGGRPRGAVNDVGTGTRRISR